MELFVEKNPSYISAAKLILAAAAPAQRLVKKPALTHLMCNAQAATILENDGYGREAALLREHLIWLDQGVSWADDGFRNLAHFFNPRSHKGLIGWTGAAQECTRYWNKAVQAWQKAHYTKAFFYLGAAGHLIQDLCVPHHAMGVLLDGHQDFEDWVSSCRDNYRVEHGGLYKRDAPPGEWLDSNARESVRHYHLVRSGSAAQRFHKATSVLLPRAQRTSAGFYLHFFHQMPQYVGLQK